MKKNDFFTAVLVVLLLCSVLAIFYGLTQKALRFAAQNTAPAFTQAIVNFDEADWTE